jgi:presenilin-like A22 family membrane protease
VLFVVPTTLSYSFREDTAQMAAEGATTTAGEGATDDGAHDDATRVDTEATSAGPADGGLERDALFIGLGDAVMPAILTASAAFFLDTPTILGIELAALGAFVGMLVGLLILLRMVLLGRAHAGLPLLNGGTITGYLLGALAGGVSLVEALGLAPYL